MKGKKMYKIVYRILTPSMIQNADYGKKIERTRSLLGPFSSHQEAERALTNLAKNPDFLGGGILVCGANEMEEEFEAAAYGR